VVEKDEDKPEKMQVLVHSYNEGYGGRSRLVK